MSTAVTKAKKTDVSTEVLDDIFETAGEGASFDSSEMQIPFVRVAQSLSPQLKRTKAEYIDGLKDGDIFNTVTGQYWAGSEGIIVIPCFQTTKYLMFTPREQGGGFKGELSPTDPIMQRTTRSGAKEILPTGDELVKSDQHFCLLVEPDGTFQPAVVDMKSTQLKVSRRWKTNIAMQKLKHPVTGVPVTPAVYATMWRLTTTEESNEKGDYYNYQVEKVGLVSDRNLLLEAKAFRDSIMRGEVKAAPEDHDSMGGSSVDGDDIPF